MKQKYFLILLGLLFASTLIVGCGGGGGNGGNGEGDVDPNWLVGTWEGTIPQRPEGYGGAGAGDFEGLSISITVQGNPDSIHGGTAFAYSGTLSFNGAPNNPYSFNKTIDPDTTIYSLVWAYSEPSVTLYVSRPTPLHPLIINLSTNEESQSITSNSLKCDWQIDIPTSEGEIDKTDGNSGIPNYHIVLNKQ